MSAPGNEAGSEPPSGSGRDNGQRLGLRFRRGSRGALRPGEIPLIGVVSMEQPAEIMEAVPPVDTAPDEPLTEVAEEARPVRPRRSRAKRAVAAPEEPVPDAPADPAPRPKRPRTRTRKKAE